MSRVVGVDGGGTRTRVVIVDGQDIELVRIEGPAALAAVDAPERSAQVVAETVRRAADQAGVDLPCDALWAGLAGAGDEPTRLAIEAGVRRQGLADRVVIGTDVAAAAEDAFADAPGILLTAGTGSIAWGRGSDGTVRRVGGWGARVGDEGSGWAIGLAALQSAAQSLDGRAGETALCDAVLDHIGVPDGTDPRDLASWAASASKADVAALVPAVIAVAADGDAAAMDILARATEALAEHVRALVRTDGPGAAPTRLALTGGLLDPDGPLRPRVLEALVDLDLEVVDRRVRPEMGAARLARRLLD